MPASLLKVLTCGSVDDGKSTLLGRLLLETDSVPTDQLEAAVVDTRRFGSREAGEIDPALLVDGLEAEREQAITIDVAWRYFSTPARRFVVIDTPGHVQYTRNMATGASHAQAALVLVDASKGLLEQTYRHARIVTSFGIGSVVLVVNKMDRIGWDAEVFGRIAADFATLADELGIVEHVAIPVSALHGDNVTSRSERAPWFEGAPLLEHLEQLEPARIGGDHGDRSTLPLRMNVQGVQRSEGVRWLLGTVASGTIGVGDTVEALPSRQRGTVARLQRLGDEVERAGAEDPVAIVLAEDVDVGRGQVLARPDAPTDVGRQFAARIVWFGQEPMVPSRPYVLQLGTASRIATVTRLRHRTDVVTGAELADRTLEMNALGVVDIDVDRDLALDPYPDHPDTGAFVLIDRASAEVVAAGMVAHTLRRSTNVSWEQHAVGPNERGRLLGQRPTVLWFTGLSGSGKSTIADTVERALHAGGRATMLLDADNVRHGLNRDLGFTEADRAENVRRLAEAARLLADAGIIVLVCAISPRNEEREGARAIVGADRFIEVHVATSLEVCEERDPKGLYARARGGEIPNFTGIDAPYETPEAPDLRIDTGTTAVEDAASRVLALLDERAFDRPGG
jgi:bifunctional enzyme CysN/CysC